MTISKKSISNGIARGTTTYQSILKKAFYIFKHLASYDEELDIDDPFHDNVGDLFFFLKLEDGDNGQAKQLALFDELELPDFYNKYVELPEGYENDKTSSKLFNLIEYSDKSMFLTGKAGTGKSTFIRYFTTKTEKSVLLVAFTGIAAINIGGQTIHSFFRFPFKPLLPNDPDITIFNQFYQKKKILEKTDTIIIDEVSMLRSDILEGLDYSLRINGGNPNKIFGGKQLILVGDIFQLPPVIDSADEVERQLFKTFYDSEYFFDSIAYKQLNPQVFEFNEVHRQSNEEFISLLNKVRDCSIDNSGIDELNKRYNPAYTPKPEEFVIILTTNNYLAKIDNITKLNSLPYKSHFFKANITGDFKEDKYPTEPVLELRRNSQIMLAKNDSVDKGRRWVNGTIAKIEFLDDEKIEIRLKDGSIHTLQKETWENRQYQWDKNKGRITSKVIGTFEQYPLKLAWAITIHKSQGLTFECVIIDLGSGAFLNGQLYTALSRCRTLEGLTLKRQIKRTDIIADKRLIKFYQGVKNNSNLIDVLEKNEYLFENDYFILRLISVHYPFTMDEIKEYSSIIKWGSGVNSWGEPDPYYQQHSFAKYGLYFNCNIDWQNNILQYQKLEANSYQMTGYDENEFPLSKEIDTLIEIYFNHFEVYDNQDMEVYDDTINKRDFFCSATKKEFNFYSLNELIEATKNLSHIFCLNKILFNNFDFLLKKEKKESIPTILKK